MGGPFDFGEKEVTVKAQHILALYLEKLLSFGQREASKAELCVAVSDAMTEGEVQMVYDALGLIGCGRVVCHSTAVRLAYINKERATLLADPKCVLFIDIGFSQAAAS